MIQVVETTVQVGEETPFPRSPHWNYMSAHMALALKVSVTDRDAFESFVHTERNDLTRDIDILTLLVEKFCYTLDQISLNGEQALVFCDTYNEDQFLVSEDSLSELLAGQEVFMLGVCVDAT